MTRLLLPPERITVKSDDSGSPTQFDWRSQTHTVVFVAARWRADSEWWLHRQWREHFKVVTDSGLLLTIYCDLGSGNKGWYVQRIYD